MRVLIIGHACSSRQGSEAAGTWNWAWYLSLRHEVSVLAFPHDRDAVEEFLSSNPKRNLKFHWITPNGSLGKYSRDRGVQSPWLYLSWQALAYQKAMDLQKEIGFDVVHHVSYGSVSAPPPVQRLGIPFVWGPLGGAQRTPSSFRPYFGGAWRREIARNARVRLLRFSPWLRSTAAASSVILATNRETATLLKQIGAADVRLFLDSGISPSFLSDGCNCKSSGESLTLLWVGRMQPRKALQLALEALAETGDVNVHLLIAGDGEMRRSWEDCTQRLHLETKVTFLGAVPWDQMPRLYRSADAFLFTSLRDSFGMQVLEAMAQGLPILALDHQGVGTFVPHDAGIKIPVTTPRETVNQIAAGIRWLARNPVARRKLGDAGRAFAKTHTWERHAEEMSHLYEEIVGARGSPKLGSPASYGSFAVTKRISTIDATVDLKGKRVLDLGCGNGCYTAELGRRAACVCGVDLQMANLKAFRTALPRFQGDGENLPFRKESFDAITMIEVLEHTHSDGTVLEECCRVLKPGGLLVVFVPNKLYPFESHPCYVGSYSIGRNIPLASWFPESLRKHLCHARIYTRRKLLAMAQRAGLQVRKTAYIFPPLDSLRLPFKEAYRRVARWLERSPVAMFGVSIYAVFEKPKRSARTMRSARWIHDRGRSHPIAVTGQHYSGRDQP